MEEVCQARPCETGRERIMLPTVQLRHVTREDVNRISHWLNDEEVASRWFGHYACGDPVHRGYEPTLMLNANDQDWARVFDHNRGHLIFSIYARDEGHIGECQAVFDEHGDVEMSLLVGRRDLWQRGYGASAAIQLLDRTFYEYSVEQAWVSIPQENTAALRLFTRLGFAPISEAYMCTAMNGGRLRATTLVLQSADYHSRKLPPTMSQETLSPIVTVTGLPGSGSEVVGAEIARLIKAKFFDRNIVDSLSAQLDRSVGEIRALEASYTSIWARALRATLAPWERYGAMDYSAEFIGGLPSERYLDEPIDYLTKDKYLAGLKSVIRELVSDAPAVLHEYGAPLFIPEGRPTFHVFVEMPIELRAQKAQFEEDLTMKDALGILRRADREFISMHKNLLGAHPLSDTRYDMTVHMNRLSVEGAARMVSGAMTRSAGVRRSTTQRTLQPA